MDLRLGEVEWACSDKSDVSQVMVMTAPPSKSLLGYRGDNLSPRSLFPVTWSPAQPQLGTQRVH